MTKPQQSSSADGSAGDETVSDVSGSRPAGGGDGRVQVSRGERNGSRSSLGSRPGARSGSQRLSALQVATFGVLAALALILGYIEALFPLPIPIPGIKLGLGNIVVLYVLATMGTGPGFAIMIVKVVASALLFGNPSVFLYSLAGALLSFAAMALAIRIRRLSLVGVSMIGGVCHMLGQLLVVGVVLTWSIASFYMPVLIVAGLATGAVIGFLCRLIIRATRGSAILREQRKRIAARGAMAGPAAQDAQGQQVRAATAARVDAESASGFEAGSAADAASRKDDHQ